MTNTSTDQNKNSSDENKVKLLWEILKPYRGGSGNLNNTYK